jgi:hypothetical protein
MVQRGEQEPGGLLAGRMLPVLDLTLSFNGKRHSALDYASASGDGRSACTVVCLDRQSALD